MGQSLWSYLKGHSHGTEPVGLIKGTFSWDRNGQSRVVSLFKGTANLMEKKRTERVGLLTSNCVKWYTIL